MKQTAVEWLIGQIKGYESDCEIFQIAKEMEQAQNERSRIIGYSQGYEHAMNMVGIDLNEH